MYYIAKIPYDFKPGHVGLDYGYGSATQWLCDLGQVIFPPQTLISLPIKYRIMTYTSQNCNANEIIK